MRVARQPLRRAERAACPAARPWIAASLSLLVAAVTLVASGAVTRTARADEVTGSVDALRTGWDQNEPGLAPLNDGGPVGGPTFGKLFSTQVNGQVYAQPIVADGVLIVATEDDWVYGLNPVSGAVIWSVQLGPSWPASSLGCTDLSPNVGVTSTPVYDPASQTVYLVGEVNDGATVDQPHYYIFALAAQSGSVLWKAPISGAPVNDPDRPFNPFTQLQRPALLLMNGSVYAGFGSHCDFTPYAGYVAGVNTSTHAVTLWTDETGVSEHMGGIWQGGGGLVTDGPGRLLVSTGNGVSPGPGPGSSPPGQLAESVVRLGVQADASLAAQDFFSPANAPTLDANDEDLGSGGPVGLPFGTSTFPHLLVQAGKDGRVFLLNRDSLGGRETGTNGTDNVVSVSGPYHGQWGHPAAFAGSNGADYVYYLGTGEGTTDFLRALHFDGSNASHPVLTDVANSVGAFAFGSGSPVVTSNGTDPASGVVWEVYSSGASGSGGQLEAFDAVPQNVSGTLQMKQIWSAPIGTASKFSVPATDSGRVYVGTRDGNVFGFGSPDTAPLDGSPAAFGQVAVGGNATTQVTVTATANVTVSKITASAAAAPDPFTAGTPVDASNNPVTLPAALKPGDKLTVPVTFAPAAPGGATGALSFATDAANFPSVDIGLSGNGTKPGFYATPQSLQFGTVPTGSKLALTVDITNSGTAGETVSSVTPPGDPSFTVTGLPAAGTVVSPGASVTATVTYAPAAAGSDSSSFAISATSGTLTVNLSATAVTGQGTLTASTTSLSFGSVALGQPATQTIDISNTGNIPLTITGTAPPTVPFGTPDPVTSGLPLGPGNDLQLPITFTPTNAGPAADTYAFTASDGQHPPQTVTVALSGTATAPASGVAAPPPGGGWRLNGSARMSGTDTVLTPAATHQAGSAVYATAVPSDGLHVHFTAQIGGGTGADGTALDLLNASNTGATALGGDGGGLGFAGLNGIAVALVTYQHTGYPSANFVGVATGGSGGTLTFAATSTAIGNLRSGTHAVDVAVSGSTVTVAVDGQQVLSPSVTVPAQIRLAFSGGTGGLTDVHTVRGVTIATAAGPLPPPGGGWSYNGSAAMPGSDTALTPAAFHQAGSVVYPTPVLTDGLHVQFNAQIGGGSGADGLTFALLNPAQATASALGGDGGGLGFAGLNGIAVTLNTYKDSGYPTDNFVGIATGSSGGLLTFQVTARGIPQLRTGTHTVGVDVSGGVITVWLDGEQVLTHTESLPPAALLAFTGATGGLTDVHTIRNIAISAASYALTPPGGSGWSYNGTAAMSGTSLVLTPVQQYAHGSAFNATAVPSAGLHVRFTSQIGGGTGADGLALVLLDAGKAGPQSIGVDGGGLGFSGLPGVAVALVTYKHASYPSNNFVGVATGGSGSTLNFAATSTAIGNLRSGSHAVDVTVSAAGQITVSVDGTQVIAATVQVPPTVLVGFSGGTGGLDDAHTVTNVLATP